MKYLVVEGKPEHLWQEIKNRVVGAQDEDPNRIWITYGNKIYSEKNIPPDILEHELVHVHQQTEDMDKDVWWNRWLNDVEFRYEQELAGYRRQVDFMSTKIKDKNRFNKYKHDIAVILSGALYGNLKKYSQVIKDLS